MRVFLYCIDALEYDFILHRNYPNIKQAQFEKVHIPLRCMTEKSDGLITPFSPVMWKQILTGRCESDAPARKPDRYKNPVLTWLLRRDAVRKSWRLLISKRLIKKGVPVQLGFERKNILEDEESLLTVAKNPFILQDPVIAEVKWAGVKSLEFKPFKTLEYFVGIFEDEKKETLSQINGDWDLFLFYTKLLDVSGHLLWGKDDYMEKYYHKIERLAGEIRDSLPRDAALIILSDHGMSLPEGSRIGGRHSHHAYISFSHTTNIPENFNVLHIRNIVEGFMKKTV